MGIFLEGPSRIVINIDMATVATLTTALPYLSGSNVYAWQIGVTFTEGTSGVEGFYQSEFFNEVVYDDPIYGWTPAATSNWSTVADLTALVPMGHYSLVFEEQIASVDDPPGEIEQDDTYVVPTS